MSWPSSQSFPSSYLLLDTAATSRSPFIRLIALRQKAFLTVYFFTRYLSKDSSNPKPFIQAVDTGSLPPLTASLLPVHPNIKIQLTWPQYTDTKCAQSPWPTPEWLVRLITTLSRLMATRPAPPTLHRHPTILNTITTTLHRDTLPTGALLHRKWSLDLLSCRMSALRRRQNRLGLLHPVSMVMVLRSPCPLASVRRRERRGRSSPNYMQHSQMPMRTPGFSLVRYRLGGMAKC